MTPLSTSLFPSSKMAKRSREDFEPSISDSSTPSNSTPKNTAISVLHPKYVEENYSTKILHLDSVGGEASFLTAEMRCSLPPHRNTLSFQSFEDYDVHYSKEHMHRCLECRKNFPTSHFLNLHIEENHDSLVSVRKERGEKTYICFVEDCDRLCSTPQKRRMHLIDKHMFPKDYDFYVVNDGIDRRSSMLRSGRHRRRSSAHQHAGEIESRLRRRAGTQENGDADDAEEERSETDPSNITEVENKNREMNEDMEGLTGAMSALKFVPPSIRFGRGRGKGRGGFSKS